jgi:hypothetical protein
MDHDGSPDYGLARLWEGEFRAGQDTPFIIAHTECLLPSPYYICLCIALLASKPLETSACYLPLCFSRPPALDHASTMKSEEGLAGWDAASVEAV